MPFLTFLGLFIHLSLSSTCLSFFKGVSWLVRREVDNIETGNVSNVLMKKTQNINIYFSYRCQ